MSSDREQLHTSLMGEIAEILPYLVGRLKTLIDATAADPIQRKATKDMVDHIVYHDFGDKVYAVMNEVLLKEVLVSTK